MKFIDPRDSNLEIQSQISSDRQHSKLRSLGIVGLVVTSAIVLTSAMTSLVQAQSTKPPATPFETGASPSDTNTNAAITSQGMTNHSMMMSGMMNGEVADRHFIEMMIPHHKMALMMSNMIVDSDRPEMRKLAQNILRSQSQEIDQMQGWYSNLR